MQKWVGDAFELGQEWKPCDQGSQALQGIERSLWDMEERGEKTINISWGRGTQFPT